MAEEEGVRVPRVASDESIKSAYTTPGHPVAFSAPATVANHFAISEDRARRILEDVDTYTLHREWKKPPLTNPFYVHGRRKQVQSDLIDIAKIAATNDGVRFLLLLIDVMTKKVWIYPLKTKSGREVEEGLRKWLGDLGGDKPEVCLTDSGKEYKNRSVQELFRSEGIEWQAAKGLTKAAVAERANKTIQVLIYKYLSDAEQTRYLDKLESLVQTYNSRPHRTLEGMTPDEADEPENEARVQEIFHRKYSKLAEARSKRTPKFKVGNLVRVKILPRAISSSRRAYAEQFHGSFYRVVRINRTMPVPMYYLRALDDGEFIDGGFYSQELQRVSGNLWKIEKILGRRKRRGVNEIHVKWRYFGDQWNEWIPETNVERVF